MERFAGIPVGDLARRAAVEIEREKRYLLEALPRDLSPGVRIEQGFIVQEGDVEVRIRKTTDMQSNAVTCELTVKDRADRAAVQEATTEIPLETFGKLRSRALVPETWMVKIRRTRGPWEVDEILQGKYAGDIVAEVEHDGQAPDPPADFKVKRQL